MRIDQMIKLTNLITENIVDGMDTEDLENCDVYPLPDWWNDDRYELVPTGEITEIEFASKEDYATYAKKHKMRDSTVVTINGEKTTAGALTKSGAEKTNRPNPVILKKYKKYKLNAYPPLNVDEKDVIVNTEGNVNNHAVLKWKDPKSGRMVSAYTPKFLQKNAKIKWKRVERLKPEYVDRIYQKSLAALKSRKPVERDVGAIIAIISKTGLRPGSIVGFEDTNNRGVSTLSPDNVNVKKDNIKINFVGKSYMENNAEIKDEVLANYLSQLKEKRKGEEFLFNVTTGQLHKVFDQRLGRKGIKIKDLRTYTATKMAENILKSNKMPPPPLPKTDKEIKKAVKEKLKDVFERVSQKLNNTPAMAKSSYVHPKIIEQWLDDMGVKPELRGK